MQDVLSSRASTTQDLQRAAQRQREEVLLGLFNGMKNRFLKEWFERFREISGLGMYEFLERQGQLKPLLENKFMCQQILSFYRNANSLHGLYTQFFRGNNKNINEKILGHRVGLTSARACSSTTRPASSASAVRPPRPRRPSR